MHWALERVSTPHPNTHTHTHSPRYFHRTTPKNLGLEALATPWPKPKRPSLTQKNSSRATEALPAPQPGLKPEGRGVEDEAFREAKG